MTPALLPAVVAGWIRFLAWLAFLAVCFGVFATAPNRLVGWRPLLWILIAAPAFAFTARLGLRGGLRPLFRMAWLENHSARIVLWSVSGGFLLRTLFVLMAPPVQLSDFNEYVGLANNLLDTGQYFSHTENGTVWYAYRPPGYAAFLAGWIWVFGKSPWLPAISNLLLYVGTALLLDRMARRWAGAAPAALAQLLFAVWPSHIAMTGLAHYEPLLAFLMMLSWWLFLDQECPGCWAAAGLITGFSVLVRQILLPAPFFWLLHRAIRPGSRSRALLAVALASVALYAVVLPWAARNRGKGLSAMVATNGGQALYQGANDDATADYNDVPSVNMQRKMNWNEERADIEMAALARQWIAANPEKWISLMLAKQAYFLGEDTSGFYWSLRMPYNTGGAVYAGLQGIAHLWWIGVWFLATLAAVAQRDLLRNSSALQFFLWMIVFFVVAAAPFTIQPRYHMPFVPLALVIAGLAVRPLPE